MNCKDCGVELSSENTYVRKSKVKPKLCRKCENKRRVALQQKRKIEAIEYKGGQCSVCGYKTFYGALEFHHVEPEEKEADWKNMQNWSLANIKRELDKCILVCSNCHRELHNEIYLAEIGSIAQQDRATAF